MSSAAWFHPCSPGKEEEQECPQPMLKSPGSFPGLCPHRSCEGGSSGQLKGQSTLWTVPSSGTVSLPSLPALESRGSARLSASQLVGLQASPSEVPLPLPLHSFCQGCHCLSDRRGTSGPVSRLGEGRGEFQPSLQLVSPQVSESDTPHHLEFNFLLTVPVRHTSTN